MRKGYGNYYIVFDEEGHFEEKFTDRTEAMGFKQDMEELYPTHEIHVLLVIS